MPTKPKLKVIQGGLQSDTLWGTVRIVAAPQYAQPFSVDAIVAEEDTFMVLSAGKTVRMPSEHIISIMTEIIETLPVAPGSVIVKNGSPMRLLAIIHERQGAFVASGLDCSGFGAYFSRNCNTQLAFSRYSAFRGSIWRL